MTARPQPIEASYAACRRVARRSGSNFYRAFALLPRPQRRAMDALYAFMRRTDDLGDAGPPEYRREALAQWRRQLHAALQPSPSEPPHEILPALTDAVRRFSIPVEHLDAVIDGVAMDLDLHRYETFDELAEYCHRVASAVGLACIHIWGFRGPEAFEPARACGLAFQLTNILRDVREDAAMGRIYLPLEDLRRFGYPVDDLMAGRLDDRYDRLMIFEIDRAESFYRQGDRLFDCLRPSGQRIFGMMVNVYHRLLASIRRDPRAVFARRVRLGRCEKTRIAARWMLLPPRRSDLP